VHVLTPPPLENIKTIEVQALGAQALREAQARLYLLNVAPGPVLESQEAALRAQLKALVPPEANLWCEPKAFVESGDPADKILEQAEELAIDLIVLGIRPVSTLAGTRTHLGTATAYDVVRRAICPVMSIRG
jgi:nucleotide-binding universal stress UspA family protein